LGSFPASLRTTRRLAHQRGRPRKDLGRAVWHLRSVLTGQDARKPSVALLSIESDGAAALTVAALATDLARDGKRVLVADFSDGSALAKAFKGRAGKTGPVEIEGATGAVTLTCPAVDLASPPKGPGGDSEKLEDEADVVVALAT